MTTQAPAKTDLETYVHVAYSEIFLTFGKHRGELITDVPDDYLHWALRTITDAPEQFHKIVRAELGRRKHQGVAAFDFGEGEV